MVRKHAWIYAGLLSLSTSLADVGVQLAGSGDVRLSRSVIAGLVVGAIGRALGAGIAALMQSNEEQN